MFLLDATTELHNLTFQGSYSLPCSIDRRGSLVPYSSGIPEGLFRHATDLMQEFANLNLQMPMALLNAAQDVALYARAVDFEQCD